MCRKYIFEKYAFEQSANVHFCNSMNRKFEGYTHYEHNIRRHLISRMKNASVRLSLFADLNATGYLIVAISCWAYLHNSKSVDPVISGILWGLEYCG